MDVVNISQKFGENSVSFYKELGMKGHNGIDFSCESGTILRAAHDGHVVYTGLDDSNGQIVVLSTNEMYDYNGQQVYFKTIYAHLTPNSYKVIPGQNVSAGDIIALTDNTGKYTTGAHLHFGLKPIEQGEENYIWTNLEQNNGYLGAIDPEPFWTGKKAFDIKLMRAMIPLLTQVIDLLKQLYATIKQNQGSISK